MPRIPPFRSVAAAAHRCVATVLALLVGLSATSPLAAQSGGATSPPPASAAPAFDPAFLGPGVSEALARWRGARITDVRYALSLDVRDRDTARGVATIRFAQPSPADIVLDFRGFTIDRLVANGATIDASSRAVWNGAHVHLAPDASRAGENVVEVAFTVPIAAAGAAIIRTRDATDPDDHLYTLLVPSDAPLLLPVFDQADLKARLSLTLTMKPTWRALANGAVTSDRVTGGARVTGFAETEPISTYLMAFAAGPYAVETRRVAIRDGGAPVPMALWVREARRKEAEVDTIIAANARALRWLGTWFDRPFPFAKYDLLLAPAFPFGGMEHPGAVFYNEQSFIYREPPTRAQLLGRQATTFHEVAHQWFGDYVTMRWFDDLWLKEGFATYMAAKMQASLEPDAGAWKTFHLRNKPTAYGTDATLGTTPVYQRLPNLDQAKSNYGPIVYNKAPSILRQLDYLVGDSAFQRGVRTFLAAYAYGNATWRDLLAHIGRAAGRDLTAWGEQWILRPGMPIIEQQLTVRDGRIARLALVQRPAQPTLSGAGAWPQRVQLRLHYPGGTDERLAVELTADTTLVAAVVGRPAPAFVYANDEDYGYALVLPDSASASWLLAHLAEVEDPFARAMLAGSLWDLVREAQLDPLRFADAALAALASERDEQIADALIDRVVGAVDRFADAPRAAAQRPRVRAAMAATVRDTTRPYGTRRAALEAWVGLADTPATLDTLARWLDGSRALGVPLTPPLRWAIVTQLVSRAAPTAAERLAAETARDTTSDGARRAFVAAAAWPDATAKRAVFDRWFADSTLNEQWVTSSLGAFFDPAHAELTRPFLAPALDTLPWIQRNRRIFFLGSWLGALLGGQNDREALDAVDAWLAAHPDLADDLRLKVLQSRDGLARRVRVRETYRVRP